MPCWAQLCRLNRAHRVHVHVRHVAQSQHANPLLQGARWDFLFTEEESLCKVIRAGHLDDTHTSKANKVTCMEVLLSNDKPVHVRYKSTTSML